jgi:hypothetical protein
MEAGGAGYHNPFSVHGPVEENVGGNGQAQQTLVDGEWRMANGIVPVGREKKSFAIGDAHCGVIAVNQGPGGAEPDHGPWGAIQVFWNTADWRHRSQRTGNPGAADWPQGNPWMIGAVVAPDSPRETHSPIRALHWVSRPAPFSSRPCCRRAPRSRACRLPTISAIPRTGVVTPSGLSAKLPD